MWHIFLIFRKSICLLVCLKFVLSSFSLALKILELEHTRLCSFESKLIWEQAHLKTSFSESKHSWEHAHQRACTPKVMQIREHAHQRACSLEILLIREQTHQSKRGIMHKKRQQKFCLLTLKAVFFWRLPQVQGSQ